MRNLKPGSRTLMKPTLCVCGDVKAQMDKIGDRPLPPTLIRETEVIEILADDVHAKMTLTVGGG
jgi:hypothetical protein